MDRQAQAIVDRVQVDRESGATRLALDTLDALSHWLESTSAGEEQIRELLETLAIARPSMVPLGNAIRRCQQCAEAPAGARDFRARLLPALVQVKAQLQGATTAIARLAAQQVPEQAVILTHSRSTQVMALFRLLAERKQPFSVICTQASPGNEGFILARDLDRLGVPVTLITDAQMGLFMARADLAVCGCDTWLADRHFVNKSGTLLLALAARAQGKPLWVLADSFKDSPATSTTVTLEEMPAGEIGAPSGAHITTRNIYFETVPNHLVSGRISEQGVVSFPAEGLR